jgi:hypothetical protein
LDVRQNKAREFTSGECGVVSRCAAVPSVFPLPHPSAFRLLVDPLRADRSRAARYFPSVLSKINWDIGAKLSYFLATGNLVSPTGLDLQQTSGYTIVAEKLNFYRYLSHFRCIHRGAFFAELKTTTVRKLLPESWGEYGTEPSSRTS